MSHTCFCKIYFFLIEVPKIEWCGLKHSVASFWVKPNFGFVSVVTLPLIFGTLRKKKSKQMIAVWLGSCSTSPPCGSSENPARDLCGGQETSWPHSLVLPRQNTGSDKAGSSWRARPLHLLSHSNPETGSGKFILNDHSCRGEAEDYPYLPPVPPLLGFNRL